MLDADRRLRLPRKAEATLRSRGGLADRASATCLRRKATMASARYFAMAFSSFCSLPRRAVSRTCSAYQSGNSVFSRRHSAVLWKVASTSCADEPAASSTDWLGPAFGAGDAFATVPVAGPVPD